MYLEKFIDAKCSGSLMFWYAWKNGIDHVTLLNAKSIGEIHKGKDKKPGGDEEQINYIIESRYSEYKMYNASMMIADVDDLVGVTNEVSIQLL